MFNAITSPPLNFFYTSRMACPYVDGRTERRMVADLTSRRGRHSHDALARAGFRRSQHLSYKPACPNCRSCVPIRVRVDDFAWTRTFRRILRNNEDLVGSPVPAEATREQFDLFQRYQIARHDEGEMALMDFADYADMVERSPIETAIIEYRDQDDRLRAGILTDIQDDGLSAVYSFYDPDDDRRSPGVFMVLDLVRKVRTLGLRHVYLGYWIENCQKMSYKTRFTPQEHLVEGQWLLWNEQK